MCKRWLDAAKLQGFGWASPATGDARLAADKHLKGLME
jgi:hypothetical protein